MKETGSLKIEQVAVDAVKLVKKPKKHLKTQRERLKQFIRLTGIFLPIIIDAENKVVNGNLRVEVAKELGLKEIPAVKIDRVMTEEEIIAFSVAEKETYDKGYWDTTLLEKKLIGFTEEQLNSLGYADIDRVLLEIKDKIRGEEKGGYVMLEFLVEEYMERKAEIDAVLDKLEKGGYRWEQSRTG